MLDDFALLATFRSHARLTALLLIELRRAIAALDVRPIGGNIVAETAIGIRAGLFGDELSANEGQADAAPLRFFRDKYGNVVFKCRHAVACTSVRRHLTIHLVWIRTVKAHMKAINAKPLDFEFTVAVAVSSSQALRF